MTADNAEEIAAQLANLNETLAALTEEQLAALDMARYEALCEQLAAQVSLTAERGRRARRPPHLRRRELQ